MYETAKMGVLLRRKQQMFKDFLYLLPLSCEKREFDR